MNILHLLTDRNFLIAILAAMSAAAAVFTFGTQFIGRQELNQRIKRVALEREKMRAEEMARLRGGDKEGRTSMRREDTSKGYARQIVDALSLHKAFVDEGTAEKLARAGYRGPGHLTTFAFFRFATPIGLFAFAFFYLNFVLYPQHPLYLNLVEALGVGILGSYLPVLLLKNATTKRQQSIRRAWPDCLDLMLLCVEAGMSIEHAFKRVAREIGQQSPELAEELTLTTAELAFLEERSRAFENLGKRTGLDIVRSVMTSLIQADRYGTSVGQSLRVMAEEGRNSRMMEAEKKAASLPPKLTVPLIVFFLPVLFIIIMTPAMIQVMNSNFHF